MELVRLVAPLSERDALITLSKEATTLFRCSDADTVIVVASLADRLSVDVGVWLFVSASYSAQLCARDIKTLSHLVSLRHAVVEAETGSSEHAEIVRALLTNDEVNFDNELATIRGAYNRPAPPTPVTVWSVEDETLTRGTETLRRQRVESRDGVELTYFA
jgi:hypothetical protein